VRFHVRRIDHLRACGSSVPGELGIISAKGRNGTAGLLEIIANEQDARIPAVARFSLAIRTSAMCECHP
jgi:hypothetical protein